MKISLCFCLVFCVFDLDAFVLGQADVSHSIATLTTMVQNLQTQVTSVQTTVAQGFKQCSSSKMQVSEATPSCQAVQASGKNSSGVYVIYPKGSLNGMPVYCDMDDDGGGWLVIQKRIDGKVDFYRNWKDYEDGFGNLTSEFYLGNKKIHELTTSGKYELLVVLTDFQGGTKKAHYKTFSLGNATTFYQLHVDGYSGDAGDSLHFDHDGHAFSTADADHDGAKTVNCASKHKGGYWYSNCFKSNINGKWGVANETGIIWGSYKNWAMYALKETEMKIRPAKSP